MQFNENFSSSNATPAALQALGAGNKAGLVVSVRRNGRVEIRTAEESSHFRSRQVGRVWFESHEAIAAYVRFESIRLEAQAALAYLKA